MILTSFDKIKKVSGPKEMTLSFPKQSDPSFYVFPDIHVKQIDISQVIVLGKIQEAPGKFWPANP
jgi:hypothetical protein